MYMLGNVTVSRNEIVELYQRCGLDADMQITPRTTINTGSLSHSFNYDTQLLRRSSDSADRLRWE